MHVSKYNLVIFWNIFFSQLFPSAQFSHLPLGCTSRAIPRNITGVFYYEILTMVVVTTLSAVTLPMKRQRRRIPHDREPHSTKPHQSRRAPVRTQTHSADGTDGIWAKQDGCRRRIRREESARLWDYSDYQRLNPAGTVYCHKDQLLSKLW